jgi:uncharacterized protein
MRILALADVEEETMFEERMRLKIGSVDLIISCGDLSADYLSYVSTVYGAPLFFVRGNHDQNINRATAVGENLHNRLVTYKGFKFLGFEGCPRYNNGVVQYTENQMKFLVYQSLLKTCFQGRPDVVIAHATPKGIHEGPDFAHRGFAAFNQFIQYSTPKYFLHGHNHLIYNPLNQTRVTEYGKTRVINVYGHYIFTLD